MKFICFLLLIIFLSCTSNRNNESLYINKRYSLKIDSVKSIDDFYIINVKLKNNSLNYLYFPISKIGVLNTNYDDASHMLSGFLVNFFDKNDKFIVPNYISPGFYKKGERSFLEQMKEINYKITDSLEVFLSQEKKQIFWGIRYLDIKKDGFFLLPQEEKECKVIITSNFYPTKRNKHFKISNYIYDSKRINVKAHFIQLFLKVDSSQTKDLILLKRDIDSLNQNGIEIFHGVLESNKVPILLL